MIIMRETPEVGH